MTDSSNRALSVPELHAMFEAVDNAELAREERKLRAGQHRTSDAERAFQAEAERDTAEQAIRALLAAHYIEPAADDEGLPCPEGQDLHSIAETLYEDWQHGTALDQLDARALVRGWAER